ncbi:hypothetical protein [Roseivirga seohaensis]|nr:hypothetical protein [Roseivirga seohaensis]
MKKKKFLLPALAFFAILLINFGAINFNGQNSNDGNLFMANAHANVNPKDCYDQVERNHGDPIIDPVIACDLSGYPSCLTVNDATFADGLNHC